ncbi:hypothetical protein HYPBUDRAFT_13851 [Hyphopichia burtonii NRRL Y-1933]|uniref:Uncharacterized protein n=1 Tax=Hyphopichia burtonii NRRL Y-1933 TaxID=984485 RepID=A0A1E4RCB2_9ASCO|nr:hypothetical protein HYPBUDRAFT_13851 [Hyphopichia burtonii NRRL Y-1933]ODV64765.1 hypothetical protein HYPBUDRAFT_13851 [Hyphopichia burtonii NRRL Y-1933]
MSVNKYPKLIIEFCARCKWHMRAVWYLQEIMQTFSDPAKNLIPDISLQPNYHQPGIFQIILVKTEDSEPEIIYKRRFKKSDELQNESYYFDGFPDSKLLKSLIRDSLWPNENLGHIDKYTKSDFLTDSNDCTDCKVHGA